jgi:hypothetical protein
VVELVYSGIRFRIDAWVDSNHCELKDFLANLPDTKRKRICSLIKRIGDKGPLENEEQFQPIEDNLYRLMTHDGIGVIWFYVNFNYIICTHAYFARDEDLGKEIAKAKLIRKSYWEVESNESSKAARNAAVFHGNV